MFDVFVSDDKDGSCVARRWHRPNNQALVERTRRSKAGLRGEVSFAAGRRNRIVGDVAREKAGIFGKFVVARSARMAGLRAAWLKDIGHVVGNSLSFGAWA